MPYQKQGELETNAKDSSPRVSAAGQRTCIGEVGVPDFIFINVNECIFIPDKVSLTGVLLVVAQVAQS